MTRNNDHNPEPSAPLLDDDDFTALMDAEFNAQNIPGDELRKQKIWNRLDSQLPQTSPPKKESVKDNPAITSFAVAAVLLIMILPAMLLDRPYDDSAERERIKGTPAYTPVLLHAFKMDTAGRLHSSTGAHRVGDTIVFKAVGHATSAALLLSRNGSPPEIRFIGDIGNNPAMQLLQTSNKVYGYMVEPRDRQLRFCMVPAENKTQLQRKLQHTGQLWNSIPAASCVDITVSG